MPGTLHGFPRGGTPEAWRLDVGPDVDEDYREPPAATNLAKQRLQTVI